MILNSAVEPIPVQILKKVENNKVEVALRRNIIQKTTMDKISGKESISYEYEEVRLVLKNNNNIVAYINGDLNGYFEKGVSLEQLNKDLEEKKIEIDELISDYGQVDVNKQLVQAIETQKTILEAEQNAIMAELTMVMAQMQIDQYISVAEMTVMLSSLMGGM